MRHRLVGWSAVVLSAGLLGVVGVGPVAGAGADASARVVPAPAPASPGPVLAIGGSSLAGLNVYSAAKQALLGADFTLDLAVCRRMYRPSCAVLGKPAPTTMVQVLDAKGAGKHTLIVFGGYNDQSTAFKEGFEKVVEKARAVGIQRIVWVTNRVPRSYVAPADPFKAGTWKANNVILAQELATGDYPDVVVADWNHYTKYEDHWFVSDGIHFTSFGAWGAADYLTRKLAFLDGRPCPTARQPEEAAQDPCPDPDLLFPDVDFVGLYAASGFPASKVTCYTIPPTGRIECRPPAKVRTVFETLRYGMSGSQVTSLQRKLISVRYLKGPSTGTFDAPTLLAVMAFQKARGLPVSGSAGAKTREKLGLGCPEVDLAAKQLCPADGEPVVFLPPVSTGKSMLVWVVQVRLKQLGFLTAKPDGKVGGTTTAAIIAFQTVQSLPPTGVVDEATALALGFVVPS